MWPKCPNNFWGHCVSIIGIQVNERITIENSPKEIHSGNVRMNPRAEHTQEAGHFFIIASNIMDYIGQPNAGVFFMITFSWVAYSFFVQSN